MAREFVEKSIEVEANRSWVEADRKDSIVQLWILRIVVEMGCFEKFVLESEFYCKDIASLLGMSSWGNRKPEKFDRNAIRNELINIHREKEKLESTLMSSSIVYENVEKLRNILGFNDVDRQILLFSVYLHNDTRLKFATSWLDKVVGKNDLVQTVSKILHISERDVYRSLRSNEPLVSSGILEFCDYCPGMISNKINLLSDTFSGQMYMDEVKGIDVLKGMIALSGEPEIGLGDYGYIRDDLTLLIPYLRESVDSGRRGVNVYIHGSPGTGKNQLVKSIGAEVGLNIFEVATEDEGGDPISYDKRVRAYRLAQNLTFGSNCIILFDEVEGVFSGSNVGGHSPGLYKGAMNKLLEGNAIPTVWVSNVISGVDHAFLRRFDYILELPVPPKGYRVKILEKYCSALLTKPQMELLSECEQLAPAIVERAASVVGLIATGLGKDEAPSSLQKIMSNTLKAQGYTFSTPRRSSFDWSVYDLSLLNTDADLAAICEGLKSCGEGRLCLIGPPGTGKTAYAHWLARALDKPLHVKKASALLSKWVGESESNIAEAFLGAGKEEAVLVIDEIDSFLQDRRQAQARWEVSAVNEMLTQMESHQGIFIASTNLMSILDQAALRRFDFKIFFDYLNQYSASQLMAKYCSEMNLPPPSNAMSDELGALGNITPGDFGAVYRRSRILKIQSTAELLECLKAECRTKERGARPIGFHR